MPQIHLHGDLARQFGGPFLLEVRDALEAVRALCVQVPGFRRRLADGCFRVIRGSLTKGRDLEIDELSIGLGSKDLHFVPVAAGSGGRTGKIILGIGIAAAAFAFAPAAVGVGAAATGGMAAEAVSVLGMSISFGQIAGFGAMMALGGISQMLSSKPSSNSTERPAQNPSFIFSGPVNAVEQGHPVPLLFGRFKGSTIVMSATMTAENI